MSFLDTLDELASDDDMLERMQVPRERILKAPFGYFGGKFRSVRHIVPKLPLRPRYVEPFGGSGVILLNREKVKSEVFNDRHSGIIDFYKCLQDDLLFEQLKAELDNMLFSREIFRECKYGWTKSKDIVKRATFWFYSMKNSFSGLGRSFGRVLKYSRGRHFINDEHFQKIHNRLKNVMIENQDALILIKDYDSPDTVFYLDPPYHPDVITTYEYKHPFGHNEHKQLLDLIFTLEGFVAISGYKCDLYDEYPWDDIHVWDSFISVWILSIIVLIYMVKNIFGLRSEQWINL